MLILHCLALSLASVVSIGKTVVSKTIVGSSSLSTRAKDFKIMIAFLQNAWRELSDAVYWPPYEEMSDLGYSFVFMFTLMAGVAFAEQYLATNFLQFMADAILK